MHNADRGDADADQLKTLGIASPSTISDRVFVAFQPQAVSDRHPKVDRSFIRDLPGESEDKAITKAIIALGKSLNLTVIAEGVETQEQAEFLRAHACDQFQGYYFSRPVDKDKFGELMRSRVQEAAPDTDGVAIAA